MIYDFQCVVNCASYIVENIVESSPILGSPFEIVNRFEGKHYMF
jgi:hypothetical protein